MLAHVALHEERAALGIEAAGDEVDREPRDALAQLGRLVIDRDRVRVDDAEEKLFLLLLDLLRPRANRAELVADVELSRRLDAGEDAGARRCIRCHTGLLPEESRENDRQMEQSAAPC